MSVITISGTPGSGKSTVCNILHEKTGLRYVYSGMIFRNLAEKHNMTLEEFGRFCENNKEIDQELDDYQLDILKKGDLILEGRLAGWIAYKNNISAFKVMLDADVETRSKRIVKRENGDFEKRKKEIMIREKSEQKRYKQYYKIDLKDKSIYDLVVDTSDKTPEEIAEEIISKI